MREGLVPVLFRAVHGLRAAHPARVLGQGEGTLQPLSPTQQLPPVTPGTRCDTNARGLSIPGRALPEVFFGTGGGDTEC